MNEITKPTQLEMINRRMQGLRLFRGTKEEIITKLQSIGDREELIVLEPFEEPLPDNDYGFNVNIGMLKDHYLDYEIYLLPTNKQDVYIITEVNEF